MFKNFLKVSIRNLVRNKTYSFINILGLAIGMVCSIIIFLFIFDELSYDRYHEKSDQIYRVGIDAMMQGRKLKAFTTGAPVGRTFVNEMPEVLLSTRIIKSQINVDEAVVRYEEKKFIEENIFYVDSTFFDMFHVELIDGESGNLLTAPNQIVITESVAKRYFDDQEPIGKSLTIQGDEYLIQAVSKDCPPNTHFHYSILGSLVSLPVANSEGWMSNDYSYTYLILEKGVNADLVKQKMVDVALKYVEPEIQDVFGVTLDEFTNAGNTFEYVLQPLTDIHLKSHTDYEIEPNSNIVYIYIFSIIAVFILIIAIINFMNLSTARSATRAKEVGLRKVIGAKRESLFYQFLFESVIMSMISLIVAMVIIESVLPFFNSFTLKQLTIGYFSNIYVLPSLLLLGVVVGIVSGLYSASYLSSSKILNVIKGKVLSGSGKARFRSFLVIFQFSISIALFICTFLIYSQLNLLRNKDIGFNKKDIVIIEKADALGQSFNSFIDELESNPVIESVAASSTLPSRMFGGLPLMIEGDVENKIYSPRTISIDQNFAKTYQLELKSGRFFSEDFPSDSFAIVLNESAVRDMGLKEPVVGKRLVTSFYGNTFYWNIIGVVKNFNFRSLHQDIGPLVLTSPFLNGTNLISVKLKSEINKKSIDFIRNKWEQFVMDTPFDYSIMENDFDNLHREEFRTGDIFIIFSLLAIFIACLGLFGLASFMAEQKTKEIGIRKALGASILTIVRLLFKQFTIWVVIANVVAWPLAYFFMKSWLQNFAYQTDIKFWIFPAAALLALLIALITVSYQAITAASKNPTDSLRYE
ncbi:MAG: ABC transporter permease [Thiohalospira sp.]